MAHSSQQGVRSLTILIAPKFTPELDRTSLPRVPRFSNSWRSREGIVFASINYRLSLFGFPHAKEIQDRGESNTQNLGLLDTRFAVEWMRANAVYFGGDPAKMTLGGESVGAGKCI